MVLLAVDERELRGHRYSWAKKAAGREGLIAAGHWCEGDPEIWIVGDTGYDGPRLAFRPADLPVRMLVRVRSDRVMAFPAPPRRAGTVGRSARHGADFTFKDPRTWPTAAHATTTQTTRYGAAQAQSWHRLHPKLTHRGTWADHDGDVPIIEGTVIRLQVDRLPGDGTPKPLWLWFSATAITPASMDRLWQMFLRRFDLEHTFRFLKQTLGWTQPRLRSPEAADRWTWLIITAHTPATAGPQPDRGPTSPLGATYSQPAPAHPGPGPTGVSQHPPDPQPASRRSETLPTRSRPPTRLTQQAPRHRALRRKDHQNGHNSRRTCETNRLNNKLRGRANR